MPGCKGQPGIVTSGLSPNRIHMSAHSHPTVADAAALVVGYQPDPAALNALLHGLLAQVRLVILLDNGGAADCLSHGSQQPAGLRCIDMQGNQGLGAALNRGMAEARACGLRYVITFDQDSAPPSGMAVALLRALCNAQAGGVRCAAIGPAFYDHREGGENCFPVFREAGGTIQVIHPAAVSPSQDPSPQEVDVLITSGMMVDSDVWKDGLHYDERLMVDYTDTDWCFRARAAGWRLFVLPSVRMPHAISDAAPIRVMGLRLLRYSPLRRYYYFRNTVYFVRQPYVSKAWRRRLLAGLVVRLFSNVVIDTHRVAGLRMSLKGLWHGLRGRMHANRS